MNFIFISPQFPKTYWNFCDRLKKNGVNVLGIGDYIGLEVNMRPAGGYTPDMIDFSHSTDVYQIWADIQRRAIGLTKIGARRYMSLERRKILQAYGEQLVLTAGSAGMKGAIAKAKELAAQITNAFIPSQFTNPANPECHKRTTAREIWEATGGELDIFVAGVGTGGTLSGVGEFLKKTNPAIKVIAVEPDSSPVLSEGKAGPHKIQGISASFVPGTLNTQIYDEVFRVTNDKAYSTAKEIARTEGNRSLCANCL